MMEFSRNAAIVFYLQKMTNAMLAFQKIYSEVNPNTPDADTEKFLQTNK